MFPAIFGVFGALIVTTHASSGASCCSCLSAVLGNAVSYPNSSIYVSEQFGLPDTGYFTAQESEVLPACRVTPTSANDVATIVNIAVEEKCQFAVRGGGHATFAGAANIGDQGFTIDLSNLSSIQVSADHKTVTVGAGARWIDAYDVLDSLNISIAGGREAPVGVAGLTLGGGKSFFSGSQGFVCDTVNTFELVTGKGTVLQVSNATYPDLFKALKGGSNNFGVVTAFTFNTFPQGQLWGGFNINLGSSASQQFVALGSFINQTGSRFTGTEAIISYVNLAGFEVFANFFTNTNAEANPPEIADFVAIEPVLENTFRIDNLSSFANELSVGQGSGSRFLWGVYTVSPDLTFFNDSYNTFRALFNPLVANGSVTTSSTAYQLLSKPMLAHGCGQNSLGLCADNGPLVIINWGISWSSSASDAAVNAASQQFLTTMTDEAKKRGLYNKYVYLNYALSSQNPLGSYGKDNVAAMRAVRREYDPDSVFQNLVPGGFKLKNA